MIVADTGPIIAFARLRRLDLLRQAVESLVIPDAVYEELVGRGHDRPGAAEVAQGGWIHRRTVTDQEAVAQLPRVLHAGEREAIVLAHELQAQLLIDEQRGREIATAQGLEVVGILRIFADAKRRGLIPVARPLVAALLTMGYWMDEEGVIRPFMDEMGEAEQREA
jgi:predicted nucleic acid-binding protein